jgi:hypothetical protein
MKNTTLRKQKRSRRGRSSKSKSSSKSSSKSKSKSKSSNADVYLQLVPRFLEMINTVKLYHWRTLSFSTHKATDELFATLNLKVDNFVEVLLGKAVRGRDALLQVPGNGLVLRTYTNNDEFKTVIHSYIQFLLGLSKTPVFNTLANTDLLNLRDEMVGILNQFLYLLTLS